MAPSDGNAGTIDAANNSLKEANSKVSDQHGKCADALDKLISAVNHALSTMSHVSWLGGLGGLAAAKIYGDKVHDAMEKLKKTIEDVLKLVKKILDEGVPVFSLITRAFDWLNQVQAPVSGMSDTAATYTINLNNWSGPVRNAYGQRLPIQTKAIDTFAGAAGDMASWLGDLAAANAAYIVACFKPLFDVTKTILAAVADAATIAGVLEALGKVGQFVEIAVDSLYDALANAVDQFTGVVNKMIDAKKSMGDLGDSWPQMVTM